jgi:hypothetical protein|tara:strand:+ start:179 stop:592 length:414 start_codon:yes stop_codon:yes gene_type:complete
MGQTASLRVQEGVIDTKTNLQNNMQAAQTPNQHARVLVSNKIRYEAICRLELDERKRVNALNKNAKKQWDEETLAGLNPPDLVKVAPTHKCKAKFVATPLTKTEKKGRAETDEVEFCVRKADPYVDSEWAEQHQQLY